MFVSWRGSSIVGGVVLRSDALARALLLAMEQDNEKKRKTKKTLGVRMDMLAPPPKGLRAKAQKVIKKLHFQLNYVDFLAMMFSLTWA